MSLLQNLFQAFQQEAFRSKCFKGHDKQLESGRLQCPSEIIIRVVHIHIQFIKAVNQWGRKCVRRNASCEQKVALVDQKLLIDAVYLLTVEIRFIQPPSLVD